MTSKKTLAMNTGILWAATGILLIGMLIARAVFPELLWLTAAVGIPLVVALGLLIRENKTALRSRSAAYGLNSAVTVVLVIGIIGVLNFLGSRYPLKADWTKNKLHTLSEQTVKLVKGLQKPIKAVLYAKLGEREKFRPLLDNYKGLNPKFEVEYVDPDREPTRAKQANIRKYGTLQLIASQGEATRESKVEELTEEKLTNALIKLLKEKSPTLCAITGHGEKSFNAADAEGYQAVSKALGDQSYTVKELSLMQEGKVPEYCDAIAVMGPSKSFFEAEIKTLKAYLENGGRALIALDINVKGGEYAPELMPVLEGWNVKPSWAVIVDPLSKMLGVDAAVPIVATYSKEHAITRDFQANSFFPFARPLDIVPGAPQGMTVQWLGQTTPKSWAVTDSKQLTSGQIRLTEGQDEKGPLNVAIAVDGKQKDSKATRNTRLVVFGSSLFATNNYSRFGGNLDLFLNATSWLMEDESLIAIRAKEDGAGKIELSQKAGTSIFLLSVIIVPLLISVGGIVNWVRRRKL
jgi:ABC-type uncharacterized transport system involved in gliding motility auxiliary subunit